ncbi:MAG: sigma-70 family RNA polymerase sigma factor [Proteobacteria bacterium]|jgi:RNA polymerase sigma-32 factor|nr:sigma-70 family RNA polymerase sigma factor [Pseudomonadota bacterium]
MLPNTLGINSLTQSGLSQYISYVNSIPLLSEEEEKSLLKDFTQNHNQNAGKKVAEAHLRIVVKIAMEFRTYCNNLWDMIAEGNVGLLKALKNFSPAKEVRFVTYATLWVKASIQEFVLRSSANVKISIGQMQKKILFNMGKVKAALNKYSQKNCTTKEIADILEVPESEINALQFAIGESSLDAQTSGEGETTIQDITPAETPTPEDYFLEVKNHNQNKNTIIQAFKKLNEREISVIKKRFLTNKQSTLLDISKELGVSVERVRQIEAAALKKMKTSLQ